MTRKTRAEVADLRNPSYTAGERHEAVEAIRAIASREALSAVFDGDHATSDAWWAIWLIADDRLLDCLAENRDERAAAGLRGLGHFLDRADLAT